MNPNHPMTKKPELALPFFIRGPMIFGQKLNHDERKFRSSPPVAAELVCEITDSCSGHFMSYPPQVAAAHREFIVRASNSHHALVAALGGMVAEAVAHRISSGKEQLPEPAALAAARAALEQAADPDAWMPQPARVLVVVQGGVVQNVITDRAAEWLLLDWDSINAGGGFDPGALCCAEVQSKAAMSKITNEARREAVAKRKAVRDENK